MFDKEFSLMCMDTPPADYEESYSSFPPHVSLAMMYVPAQRFDNLYSAEKALKQGTLFADLDLPFYGSKKGWKK